MQWSRQRLAALCRSVAEHVIRDPNVLHLAIKGRAPDAELTRHLRHLPAVVVEREADGFGFDLLERSYISAVVDEPQGMRVATVEIGGRQGGRDRRIGGD